MGTPNIAIISRKEAIVEQIIVKYGRLCKHSSHRGANHSEIWTSGQAFDLHTGTLEKLRSV